MRLHPKAPESLAMKMRQKSQESWQLVRSSKSVIGTQDECLRFSHVLPPGWTKAVSGSSLEREAEVGVPLWALCSAGRALQGDRSLLPPP